MGMGNRKNGHGTNRKNGHGLLTQSTKKIIIILIVKMGMV